jgi:hypothetical protein
MLRREFLMKATRYNHKQASLGGWYASQRLDTLRVFWDGGLSRGVPIIEVPWAGVIDPKNKYCKTTVDNLATGLWDKRGEPVNAPDAMLNTLPPLMLDGMLSWVGQEWDFAVFSSPHPDNFLLEGCIDNRDMFHVMCADKCRTFLEARNRELGGGFLRVQDGATFEEELLCLANTFDYGNTYLLQQTKLPETDYTAALTRLFKASVAAGNKGIILRSPNSQWEPQQVKNVLWYVE